MVALAGWIGAGLLCLAPFLINYTIGKILAIVGLALLTTQAVKQKMHNLIVLNVVGIIGYIWSLV
jgi:hypothetical protein